MVGLDSLPWRFLRSFFSSIQSLEFFIVLHRLPKPIWVRTFSYFTCFATAGCVPKAFGRVGDATPQNKQRKTFFAFVLFGKSMTTPPPKPALIAWVVINSNCCGFSGYNWKTKKKRTHSKTVHKILHKMHWRRRQLKLECGVCQNISGLNTKIFRQWLLKQSSWLNLQ